MGTNIQDQSYHVYETRDVDALTELETQIAHYVNSFMQANGKYQPLSNSPTATGEAGFFHHCVVNAKNNFWRIEDTGPADPKTMIPAYPSALAKGDSVIIVETSEYLNLTPQKSADVKGRCFPVDGNSHLIVFGNVVCIQGKIEAPGKHIVIFARELRTLAAGSQQAELNVDAKNLPDNAIPSLGHAAPAGSGEPGSEAQQRTQYWHEITWDNPKWDQISAGDGSDIFGGKGGPGQDGKPGLMGEAGRPGGEIYIVCDSIQDYGKLTLSTSGGQGGRGGTGQKGGPGGPGGKGVDKKQGTGYKVRVFDSALHGYYSAVVGGPGGKGGRGGVGGLGGPGGNSGNCTVIVNRPLSDNTKINYAVALGKNGPWGFGGEGGDPGPDGVDGDPRAAYASYPEGPERAAWARYVYAPGKYVPKYWRNGHPELEPRKGQSGDDRLKELLAPRAPSPAEQQALQMRVQLQQGLQIHVENLRASLEDLRSRAEKASAPALRKLYERDIQGREQELREQELKLKQEQEQIREQASQSLPPEFVTPPAKWGRSVLVHNVDAASGVTQNGFELRLATVKSADDLEDDVSSVLIVAFVSAQLHIRIFDVNGKQVVDKPEKALVSGPALTELKRRLNPLPDVKKLSKEAKGKIIRDACWLAAYVPEDHPFRELRGIARVSHLHKLLETGRERYLRWDTYRVNQDTEADTMKQELDALLDFLQLGIRLLPRYVSEEEKRVLDGLTATLMGMSLNVSRGLDLFGHTHHYVPLGSPSIYLEAFEKALGFLKERETKQQLYLKNLAETRDTSEQRSTAIAHAGENIEALTEDHEKLRKTLITLVKETIPPADKAVDEAANALGPALEHLRTWVKDCFGLTAEDFIDCLFNLAFIGDPIKEQGGIAKHGVFTGLTTLTSQTTKLVTKAVNTLPNDEGQPVNRKRLLLQVDKLDKQIRSLDEAYSVIQNARKPRDPGMVQLKDRDAYRLLMAQTDFDAMLEQFSTKREAQEARVAVDNYVYAIQQRNALLAEYNALVTEYLRVAGEIETTESQRASIEKLQALKAQPNLPIETAFVTALYNRTRERCVEYCYLASRAYRFWTLAERDDHLYKILKLGSPNEINYNALSGLKEELYATRTGKIQHDLEHSVQSCPPAKADYIGSGVTVLLRSSDYPQAFAQFKAHGVASFSIPVPTKGSTLQQNPFAPYYNVRLTRVRTWILGVKTNNNMCFLRVRHKGPEFIRRLDGSIVALNHARVSFQFVYDWTLAFWNIPKHCVDNPDAVLKTGGAIDGDLKYKDDYIHSKYLPLIGPFTEWEITLADGDNDKLDRSQIKAIALDFHGFCQSP